ncbi:MAG: hypothetical protein G01um101413_552 [Parcubacteria group bacterium Gr01-1014_13]|nr:MAG: hypothetical protein G01um101413_552 [Parcubacteria group bacterium Gr01-1014_13]
MDEDTNKSVEQQFAKMLADREWNDVKYSNDRENKVSDQMMATEVQASAIFITLLGVFLGKGEGLVFLDKLFLVVGILLFAISIVFGILGFYIKELFWKGMAKKYNLSSSEWVEVWRGRSKEEHALKFVQFIRNGVTYNQSPSWPVLLQIVFFFLGLVLSFIGLVSGSF